MLDVFVFCFVAGETEKLLITAEQINKMHARQKRRIWFALFFFCDSRIRI